MIALTITAPNLPAARSALAAINRTIRKEYGTLWSSLGPMLRDDTRKRIRTQDGGRWAPASKWIRAKSGSNKVLLRQDKGVLYRVFPSRLEIFHRFTGAWGINQHDAGFTENPTNTRITIPLVSPQALGLSSNAKVFSFISKNRSVVPARKIWPNYSDVQARFERITSMWIMQTLRKVPGVIP